MNKYQDEYLGKKIEVLNSSNKQLEGIEGFIFKESKNSFVIKTKEKKITILKNKTTFLINEKKINGEKIAKKPEDRIKIR